MVIPMVPKPSADTTRPCCPSARCCIVVVPPKPTLLARPAAPGPRALRGPERPVDEPVDEVAVDGQLLDGHPEDHRAEQPGEQLVRVDSLAQLPRCLSLCQPAAQHRRDAAQQVV